MTTASRNIPSLDGLRAISVCMVVAAHMNGILAHAIPFVPFWLYLNWGALGVQTFFVISGFVITNLLRRQPTDNVRHNLAYFYGRRIRRIVPAATLVLVATTFSASLVVT